LSGGLATILTQISNNRETPEVVGTLVREIRESIAALPVPDAADSAVGALPLSLQLQRPVPIRVAARLRLSSVDTIERNEGEKLFRIGGKKFMRLADALALPDQTKPRKQLVAETKPVVQRTPTGSSRVKKEP
jgi:hypothetical protein